MNNTNIVYEARLHWILFLWPALLFCFGIYLGVQFDQLRPVAYFIVLFAFFWELMVWVNYHFSYFFIKPTQVILCTGFWIRKTLDFPLNKIESIDISQSILGSLLQYGSLVITGTGGSRQVVHYISKPLTCRRHIEQLLHE